MNQDTDLQAQLICQGLTKLQELLDKPVAVGALELGKNAAAAREYEVLRRLQKSLLQYLQRNGTLFYAGVLGHFSAGKSSTINSLLGVWGSRHERATDLNPTDTTVTLITREENTASLVGVVKEGHVTIRLEPIDSAFLNDVVLVDTPGTGDPQFIEEVARDFLPICDLILFVFSAASPLDKSDVPLLLELHERLPFVPIHFIVTRVDELRVNQDAPLTEANLDARKTEQFLHTVVTRVNVLLAPDVYLASNFSLIDNRSRFRTEQLRDFLSDRCSSSNPQAQVSMHMNKLHFYRSNAKSLRIFFAGIVEKKLLELTKIVEAAKKNIDKYQQLVQISNSNLTRAWMDNASTINHAASETTLTVRPPDVLPERYIDFPSVTAKRVDLVTDLTRNGGYHAASISSSVRAEINGAVKQALYTIQRRIADTPLEDLNAEVHSSMKAPQVARPALAEVLSISVVQRRGDELREAEADALRSAAGEIRRSLNILQEQIKQRSYLSSSENAIKGGTESLRADLSNFYQNVELYRSGVFSHTTKDSIATLGIGQRLDLLETEITEDDQESYAEGAANTLFPGALDLLLLAESKGREIAEATQVLLEEARTVRIERPESNQLALEESFTFARDRLQSDLRDAIQAEMDRFFGGLSVSLANIIISAKVKYDTDLRLLRQARLKRYISAFAATALAYACASYVYYHLHLPAPTSLWGGVTLNVGSAFVFEAIVLLAVKAKENAPKLFSHAQTQIHVKLNDDVRSIFEIRLNALVLNVLNEKAIAAKLTKLYTDALDTVSSRWQERAQGTLTSLRTICGTYADLRTTYGALVEQIRQDASEYFRDSSRNLAVLNDVAAKIKAEAIEPSFNLLAETREELVTVKNEVYSVTFD